MPSKMKLSPSQLNDACRLAAVAQRCGPQFLDDAKSFDEMFGRNRFAGLDGHVLDLARRLAGSS
jgi:hypothetical protein